MQNADFAARRHPETVAEHTSPAVEPQPAETSTPKVGDRVRLKKPWRVLWRGKSRAYRVGVIEEVLGGGDLFALKFSTYPNTVDLGRSLLDLPEARK